jgi:membrane fusion protein, multidrug efflux system
MTTKKYDMKLLKIFSAVIILFLASCGQGSKETKSTLTEKKTRLEKLQNDRAKIDAEIKTLQEEIVKLDSSASLNKGKLVTIVPVLSQPFEHFIDLDGHVDADNISYVTPRGMPKQVKNVYIKKGDFVRRGQMLLKLDDAVELTQLKQLENQLAYTEDLYRRQKNLWDQGIGTEVQLKNAENSVKNLKDQINTLKTSWEMTNVRSDVNGYVEQLNIRTGEIFSGYVGSIPQIMIVNTSALKVVTEVPENYVSRLQKGTPVSISIPDAGLEFNSSISLISQTVGLNNRTVSTEAKIPYNAKIHINQVARVRIKDYSNPNAITIPLTALQSEQNKKYVYVVVDEKGKKIARRKYVQAGQIYGEKIEVTGLAAGDQLITEGYQSLYDGQVVTVG